jgi:hypothetical protein
MAVRLLGSLQLYHPYEPVLAAVIAECPDFHFAVALEGFRASPNLTRGSADLRNQVSTGNRR